MLAPDLSLDPREALLRHEGKQVGGWGEREGGQG